jgi:hypothetical protein
MSNYQTTVSLVDPVPDRSLELNQLVLVEEPRAGEVLESDNRVAEYGHELRFGVLAI